MTEVIYEAPQAIDYPVGTIIKHPVYGYVQCEYNVLGTPGSQYWRNLARWERKRVKKYGTDTPVTVPESHAEPLTDPGGTSVYPPRVWTDWDRGYAAGWDDCQNGVSYGWSK